MQRITLAGSCSLLTLSLCLAAATPAQAQDRAGAAMAGGQAGQPPPPPPVGGGAGGGVVPPVGAVPPPAGGGAGGGVIPPGVIPRGAGGGVVVGGVGVAIGAGNLGIGTIPVMPPAPIGYYAPVRAVDYNLGKFFYYPFYYYPHSYWPTQTCPWPERPGEPYMRPPAYMAYPPFLEPHWRYEWYTPQKYYRGFHFWLDQF